MRIFIALPLPDGFTSALAGAAAPLVRAAPGPAEPGSAGRARRPPRLRPVRPDAMHLTLAFLGELDEAGLADAERAASEAVSAALAAGAAPGPARGPLRGPFRLSAAGILTFPTRGRASVIAAAIGDGEAEASALAAAVEDALERVGRESGRPFRPRERRPFVPHVTLARADRPGVALSAAERAALDASIATDVAACVVDRLVVFRSVPGRAGSRYEALVEFVLARPNSPDYSTGTIS